MELIVDLVKAAGTCQRVNYLPAISDGVKQKWLTDSVS